MAAGLALVPLLCGVGGVLLAALIVLSLLPAMSARKFLDVAFRFSLQRGLSRLLTRKAEVLKLDRRNGIEMMYTIPDFLCRAESEGDARQRYMTCSAALALFDEVSTYGLMAQDKNRRSGVSVTLTAELREQRVRPGERVRVVSRCSRAGRTLGFSDIYMYNEDGEEVACGKHIKFLPMGVAYNWLTHPKVLPIAVWMLGPFLGAGDKERADGDDDNAQMPRSMTELVPLAKAGDRKEEDAAGTLLPEDAAESDRARYELVVRDDLTNPLGYLHGGAVAMACEEACHSAIEARGAAAPPADSGRDGDNHVAAVLAQRNRTVKLMSVNYLSAMSKTTEFYVDLHRLRHVAAQDAADDDTTALHVSSCDVEVHCNNKITAQCHVLFAAT